MRLSAPARLPAGFSLLDWARQECALGRLDAPPRWLCGRGACGTCEAVVAEGRTRDARGRTAGPGETVRLCQTKPDGRPVALEQS